MNREKTVLLVDDIPEYLDTMELNLPDGCRAVRAVSALEARTAADEEKPAVAVIDIRLSDSDAGNREGMELLKWMRERHPSTVVVMISAYREFDYAAESLTLGAEFFLRKPIQPEEFRTTVQKAFEKSGGGESIL
jgi:DNA-binding NtrC family response regulator